MEQETLRFYGYLQKYSITKLATRDGIAITTVTA
jgi:hypothetical protein